MNIPPRKFRAVAFLRVSEESQRDYGTSINTQRSTIAASIAQHRGRLVAEYGGAEHATPGHEHAEFDRMVNDAVAGKFDAIFVANLQRWSRDTVASEQAVRRLVRTRIRFFVGFTEWDLRSPAIQMLLTMSTKNTELETNTRINDSVKGRIEQAALGFVTSSLPPYGRFVPASLHGTKRKWAENSDGTAKWEINESERRYAEKAAKLYLAGKTWAEVGKALDDDENTVRRRVAAAGGQWQQRFRLRDGHRPEDFAGIRFFERLSFEGDYVTVTIPIPPLLDELTLKRVRRKAAAHYEDRKAPNKQVLGGYLKCANCGGSVGTHYNDQLGAVYMQHNGQRQAGCPISFGRYEPIERSVLRQFGDMLRKSENLEASVREALAAEVSRKPELEKQLREAKAAYSALTREHDDIYKKVKALNLAEGGATMLRLQADANRLDTQLKAMDEQVRELEEEFKVTRLPADFSARIEFTLYYLRGYNTNSRWLWIWPKRQQREMFQFLFGHQSRRAPGTSGAAGTQTGIYLERKVDGQSGKVVILWTAKGWFPQVSDTVWRDPKIAQHFRPAARAGGIDRGRLVELVRRLDIREFRLAELAFHAAKPECRRSSA